METLDWSILSEHPKKKQPKGLCHFAAAFRTHGDMDTSVYGAAWRQPTLAQCLPCGDIVPGRGGY